MSLADLAEQSDLSVLFIQFLHFPLVFWQYECGPFEKQRTDMSVKGGQGIIAFCRISSISFMQSLHSLSVYWQHPCGQNEEHSVVESVHSDLPCLAQPLYPGGV